MPEKSADPSPKAVDNSKTDQCAPEAHLRLAVPLGQAEVHLVPAHLVENGIEE